MSEFANATRLYEDALAAGRPDELCTVAEKLTGKLKGWPIGFERGEVDACRLHLLCVSKLNGPRLAEIEGHRVAIQQIAATYPDSIIVSKIAGIISYCSYFSRNDFARLEEAIVLFGGADGLSGLSRLDTAAMINEIASHSNALMSASPTVSIDRVDFLAQALAGRDLPDRLCMLRDIILSHFFRMVMLRYGDTRFAHMGIDHLAPSLSAPPFTPVFNNALNAYWNLAKAGIEEDPDFPLSPTIIRRSQQFVRKERHCTDPTTLEAVAGVALGLGLRARFDWERYRRRSGISRALAYFRISARSPGNKAFLGTTLRVAYEAGFGEHYLNSSSEVFDEMEADTDYHFTTPDLTNHGSTLMILGIARNDAALLHRALDRYETAIARDGQYTTVNVPRYLNFAMVVTAMVDLGHGGPDIDFDDLLERSIGYLIAANVLSSDGSINRRMAEERLDAFRRRIESNGNSAASADFLLQYGLEAFAGSEEIWPFGFSQFVIARLEELLATDDANVALVLRATKALAKAKPILQFVDIADGGNGAATQVIDQLFSVAIDVFRLLYQEGDDETALRALDELTGGFFAHVVSNVAQTVDGSLRELVTKTIGGQPLNVSEISRIRRLPVFSVFPTPEPKPRDRASQRPEYALRLLAGGKRVLILLEKGDSLSPRMLTAVDGRTTVADNSSKIVAATIDLLRKSDAKLNDGTLKLSLATRGFEPGQSNAVYLELRRKLTQLASTAVLLLRDGRSFTDTTDASEFRPLSEDQQLLLVHSPANEAPPLHYGFQFSGRLRSSTAATLVEVAESDCSLHTLSSLAKESDMLIIVSHGTGSVPNGPTDRILLADKEVLDASWLIDHAEILRGKTVFLIACNSGHINARLRSEDLGLGPLLIYLGAQAAFVTLRSVDEMTILMMVLRALQHWKHSNSLAHSLENSRREMLTWDFDRWSEEERSFIGGGMAARLAYQRLHTDTSSNDYAREEFRQKDIDRGWVFYQA